MDTIGKRIRAARRSKGVSGDRLADRLGRSKGAISQWENDLTEPPLAVLAKLCDELDVSADEILGRGRMSPSLTREQMAAYAQLPYEMKAVLDGQIADFLARHSPKKGHSRRANSA